MCSQVTRQQRFDHLWAIVVELVVRKDAPRAGLKREATQRAVIVLRDSQHLPARLRGAANLGNAIVRTATKIDDDRSRRSLDGPPKRLGRPDRFGPPARLLDRGHEP